MKYFKAYHRDSFLCVLFGALLLLHFSNLLAIPKTSFIIIAILGFLPVLWSAYQSFRAGDWASMDLLASVALVFSMLSQEWTSAIFIELMLAAARILDEITKDRTQKSIRGLLMLRPEVTKVERGNTLEKISVQDIQIGDVVIVEIGERIPIDGVVLSGTASVDESSLTGESLPLDKEAGSLVFSSTLVRSGNLRIQTTKIGKDTALERIIALVESAREEKPTSQTLGERFGKMYLIAILIGSIGLYLITHNLPLVLAVVLVVCADDIAIAIPIAYLRAIRSAAQMGVIIKGGKHLETFGKIQTIIFDKTGTLTTGTLVIADVIVGPSFSKEKVLQWGALASTRSSHPISLALLTYAKQHGWKEEFPDSVEEKGGKGLVAKKGTNTIVTGKQLFLEELGIPCTPAIIEAANKKSELGQSIMYIAYNGQLVGFVTASDQVKANASETITELRALGIKKIVMLTGDNSRVAKSMAQQLDIDEWYADLLPENKVTIIKKLQEQEPVAMIGDGVNDAAALSIASVGIAMGGLGAEGTLESAQIILMRDDLSTLPKTIRLAHMARQVSIQDFWIWGITNTAGLTLVFGGIIGPAGAAAYNFLSDFLPLSNSLRVRNKTKR